MRKTLTTLVLALQTAACSDYTLYSQRSNPSAPAEDASDTGFYEDTGTNEHTETYDACDPYGTGWQLHPEGTERNGCYAIEGYARANEDNDGLETQIYYGNCDVIGSLEAPVIVYRETDSENNIGHTSSNQTVCDGAFYSLGFTDKFTESGELSNLYVEDRIWVLSTNENTGSLSTEELSALHDPLTYVLSCNEGAESIVEDCVAFMYK